MSAGTAVCGFYGRDNLGDEAILAGLCGALAEARPSESALALTVAPQRTREQHGVATAYYQASATARRGLRRQAGLVRALGSRRGFILGGGDLLRDSPTQEVVGAWLEPLRTAQLMRRRTAVVGISVGDLHRPASLEAVRKTLDGVSFVITREQESRRRLLALDVQVSVDVAPDLALRLFKPRPPRAASTAAPRVLVSVRGLADRSGAETSAAHAGALAALASCLDALSAEGAAIELVPLRSRRDGYQPVDDDYVASLELARLATRGRHFLVHRHVDGVAELRDLLAGADLVLGMRLHSVIMAAGLRVPVLALAYDRKVTQFCDEVGLGEDCHDLDGLSAEALLAVARQKLAAPEPAAPHAALLAYEAREHVVVDRLREWR